MTAPETLVVAPRFDLHLLAEAAVLTNEHERVAVEGRFAVTALSACRTPRAVADLRRDLAGDFGGLATRVGLRHLVDRGWLVAPGDAEPGHAAWRARAGVGTRTPASAVAVRALGDPEALGATALRRHLAGCGLDVVDVGAGEPADALPVVVVDDPLDPSLAEVDAAQRAADRPWVLVQLTGVEVWCGLVLQPGVTGCWTCLADRLRENGAVRSWLRRRAADTVRAAGAVAIDPSREAAAALAALLVLQVTAGTGHVEPGVLTTLDTRTLQTRRHTLTRWPHCPACGTPPVRGARAPVVGGARLLRGTDGGVRSRTAADTVARLEPHISPLLGIVHAVEEMDTGSDVLTVHRASHPLFTARGDVRSLQETLDNATAGKGRTRDQSRASALCEAIERWSGRYQGHEIDLRAPFSEVADRAVDPRSWLLFSDRQYRERTTWNAKHSGFAWVPERFDPDRPVDWTEGWSMTTDRPVLLPTACCWYDAPTEPGHVFASADSNGCAAGAGVGEAVVQGFYELVERDAVAIWWYNRVPAPAVDLDATDEPLLRDTIAAYAARNRDLYVLDVTSDLGVPTYVAVSRRRDAREEILQGYGAHRDPSIALWRAVTEASQMLAHLNGVEPDSLQDPDLRDWYLHGRTADHPQLQPEGRAPRRTAEPASDVAGEVAWVVDLVRAHGLDLHVVDQSRPGVDLAVARVVVPGLRHFWPRFAPGRLYDVPVATGRLTTARRESELEPVPICT